MSKKLERAIDGSTIATRGNVLSVVIHGQMLNTRISVCEVLETDSVDCESGVVQHQEDITEFIQDLQGVSVLVLQMICIWRPNWMWSMCYGVISTF